MKRYEADIAPHWSKHASAVPVYLADEVDAEIAELVESLEEMLYSNSTKYREKAIELINKHKKN